MSRKLLVFAAVLGAVGLAVRAGRLYDPPSNAERMTRAEYEAVLAAVPPAPGEDRFDAVPWRLTLADARRDAAAAGKPILLWSMDGHPLGCG
jgi:hypothetical protein